LVTRIPVAVRPLRLYAVAEYVAAAAASVAIESELDTTTPFEFGLGDKTIVGLTLFSAADSLAGVALSASAVVALV
jgi:hypothetical protein